MQNFIFEEFNYRVTELLTNGVQEAACLDDNRVKNLVRKYQTEVENLKGKMKLTIAFVGQYSAGKSTIITAITGNSTIKIGQGITTDRATPYPWHEVDLIDTPGIYAERPDHDMESLRWMDVADLLVYVVTVNGFDDLIGSNFRTHSFVENRADKMMLVMNKASTESEKNKDNWIADVLKVIEPKTPQDFRMVVIDARDYLDSLTETDLEDARELARLSNFDSFVQYLNDFVRDKGLLGRLIAPLNLLQTFVNQIIDQLSGDTVEVANLLEILRQKEFIIKKSQQVLQRKCQAEIEKLFNATRQAGTTVATKIIEDCDSETIKLENEATYESTKDMCDQTVELISSLAENELKSLVQDLVILSEADLAKDLLGVGGYTLDFDVNIQDGRINERLKRFPEILSSIGCFLGKSAQNSDKIKQGASGLRAVTGSDAHQAVYNIGKFFGKEFKPYEAVKFAEKLGKAGKVLSAAQIILGPAIALWEEYQEQQYSDHIRQVRMKVRNNYATYAKTVRREFEQAVANRFKETYGVELEVMNKQRNSIRSKETMTSLTIQSLQVVEQRAVKLLSEIIENNAKE